MNLKKEKVPSETPTPKNVVKEPSLPKTQPPSSKAPALTDKSHLVQPKKRKFLSDDGETSETAKDVVQEPSLPKTQPLSSKAVEVPAELEKANPVQPKKRKSLFDVDDEEICGTASTNDCKPQTVQAKGEPLPTTQLSQAKPLPSSTSGERTADVKSESDQKTVQNSSHRDASEDRSANVLQCDLSLTSSDSESDDESSKQKKTVVDKTTPTKPLPEKPHVVDKHLPEKPNVHDKRLPEKPIVHDKPDKPEQPTNISKPNEVQNPRLFPEVKDPESYLEQTLRSFNTGFTQRELTMVKKRKESSAKMWETGDEENRKSVPCQNVAGAAVQVQLGRLWGVNSQETMENIAGQFLTQKAVECDFGRWLVQYGYVAIREEKEWEAVAEVANFAPLLTAKQSKLLSLVVMVVEADDPAMREHYKSLPDDFMSFIRHRLFAEECYFSYKQSHLANICRFFMALVRYKGDEVAAKSFLYDVFYHKGNRNFVMLTVFFDVWPEIMFWTGTSSTQLNPLLETVIWAIYNTGPPNSLAELKVFETRHKLEKTCCLPQPKGVSADSLVKYFIDATEKNFENEEWTDSTKLSLLLLARVKDFQWTHNNVIRRLLEVFGKYMRPEETAANPRRCEAVLAWVVDTVGLVSRVYPVEPARTSLKDIFASFAKLLQSGGGDMMTPGLEDACLRALINTGHHLPVQVTKFLAEWRGPQFTPLNPKTLQLVENFVGTKAYTQSAMTVQVAKKQKVFDQINKR